MVCSVVAKKKMFNKIVKPTGTKNMIIPKEPVKREGKIVLTVNQF